MSEMVDRVGKAIWDAHHAWLARSDPAERLSDACGRAAIEAMREPTEAMIVAAALDPSNQGHVSQTGTWQAMIDEALK